MNPIAGFVVHIAGFIDIEKLLIASFSDTEAISPCIRQHSASAYS
jgi:hypothetical protein